MADAYIPPSTGPAKNNNQESTLLQASGNPLADGTGDVTLLGFGDADGYINNFNNVATGAPINVGG